MTVPQSELPSLLGLPRQRLAEILAPFVDRPFRVEQVYRALYARRVDGFAAMTDLGKELRAELAARFTVGRPAVAKRHESSDGTVKYLFELADGATIEAVDIPDAQRPLGGTEGGGLQRRTLCISSQAGCALACRFCVTGYWGAGRDLTAGEIVGQVLAVTASEPTAAASPPLTPPQGTSWNLVFMGMGEPLLNLDNLADALEILFELFSWRRVTVSTAGVVPGIEAMARWPKRPRLAVSLHAPDDERRSALMPINQRYPLADLLAVLERFPLAAKERITFEYVLIRGFNDALADADALARLLRRQRAKVNLIPLNEDPVLDEAMKAPDPRRVEAFRRRLVERGLPASTRARRGDDVSAACGQLRAVGREARGFRRSNLSF